MTPEPEKDEAGRERVPLLSMHATFEMSSKADVWNFHRFMLAFYGS